MIKNIVLVLFVDFGNDYLYLVTKVCLLIAGVQAIDIILVVAVLAT